LTCSVSHSSEKAKPAFSAEMIRKQAHRISVPFRAARRRREPGGRHGDDQARDAMSFAAPAGLKTHDTR
jgi:hypothetical protein